MSCGTRSRSRIEVERKASSLGVEDRKVPRCRLVRVSLGWIYRARRVAISLGSLRYADA